MRVRLATASDEEALLEMGRCMHAESRFSRYPLDHTKLRKLIELSLTDGKVHCILVAQNLHGQLTGMLGGHVQNMFFTDALIAQDKFFYVLPESRGTSAALKLLKRLLRNQQVEPESIVTDGLASYGSALKLLRLQVCHRPGRLRENNRAENSHLPIRRRERRMLNAGRWSSSSLFFFRPTPLALVEIKTMPSS